ncbi:hypothetical protein FB451DRAFT_1402516 [Mycena latifolia]|nr:hypothetical protein FB451DRAFT_1402516 [Mycena latifolia]
MPQQSAPVQECPLRTHRESPLAARVPTVSVLHPLALLKKATAGRSKKSKNVDNDAVAAEIARLTAEIAAMHKALEECAAGANQDGQTENEITRLEKPKGEAGDRKNGFVLQTSMGLDDDDDQFCAILRSVHTNVARANLDVAEDYRHQDPGKLAAVFRLTRKEHPYLTEKRFPLNWAIAEREAILAQQAQRKGDDMEAAGTSNKRRNTGAGVRHIDDDEDESEHEAGEPQASTSVARPSALQDSLPSSLLASPSLYFHLSSAAF